MMEVDKIRLIEANFEGTLSSKDQVLFNQLLENDSSFLQEVEAYKDVLEGLEMLHLENFQENMADWESKYTNSKVKPIPKYKSKIRFMKPLYSVAAAAVLVLFVSLGAYQYMSSDIFEELTASGLPMAIISTTRDTAKLSDKDELKNKGFRAYSSKEYKMAVAAFTEYMDTYGGMSDNDVIFFLGISQLMDGDAKRASQNIEHALEHMPERAEEAEWLFALAQYKQGNIDACKKILSGIIAKVPEHGYKQKAQKLLDAL